MQPLHVYIFATGVLTFDNVVTLDAQWPLLLEKPLRKDYIYRQQIKRELADLDGRETYTSVQDTTYNWQHTTGNGTIQYAEPYSNRTITTRMVWSLLTKIP